MISNTFHDSLQPGKLAVAEVLLLGCLVSVTPSLMAQNNFANQPSSAVNSSGGGGNTVVWKDVPSDRRSFKELAEALKNEDRTVRTGAVLALGQSRDSHAVKLLVEALKDRDPDVRAYASMGLIRIGTPAVQPLINAMKENDLYASALSALALSSMSDPRAHNALMKALQEHNSRAIFGTHTYFVKLGLPGSESALIEALEKFPSQEMAEEFFNSGNPALQSAANQWAQKYRHTLKPSITTATVHWGSGQEAPVQTASAPVLSAQ